MNEIYIKEMLREARKCNRTDDVPVGAIIVKNGKIIAKGHNEKEKNKDATKHAEIIAIQKACKKLKTWHLDDCEMYVTLEPCLMCCGAIIQSRIKKVYYGIESKRFGYIESIGCLFNKKNTHKMTEVINLKNEESIKILQEFFVKKR